MLFLKQGLGESGVWTLPSYYLRVCVFLIPSARLLCEFSHCCRYLGYGGCWLNHGSRLRILGVPSFRAAITIWYVEKFHIILLFIVSHNPLFFSCEYLFWESGRGLPQKTFEKYSPLLDGDDRL